MSTNTKENRNDSRYVEATLRGRPSRRRARGWWAWLRLALLSVALAGVITVVIAYPLLPTGQVMLEESDVAHETIRAPHSLTYDSVIRQEEERERATFQVEPVYTAPDPALARQQLDRAREILDYIGSVRADTLASTAQKRAWILAVPELADLSPETTDRILTLSNESWDRVQLETLAVIGQIMRQEIREGHLTKARERVPTLVSLDLSEEEAAITTEIAQRLLVANSFYNPTATAAARARARDEVGPVTRSFEEGQVIVREGNRVTALDIEVLDQFGLRQPQIKWTDLIGPGLLAVLSVSMLCLYLERFQPEALWDGQQLLLLTLLTALFVLAAGLMIPGGAVIHYLTPAPALAMLATATLGRHAGVATAVLLGGVTGAIADNTLEMTTYTAMGGLIAALTLGRVERIAELFRAGAFASLAQVGVFFIFHLPPGLNQPGDLLASTLSSIANGGISASLTLGILFLIGPLFDIITTMRLIELSRPDHPLLQRLLREAPATHHHSLMVSNLAEQAAEAIGANALLTRVGAYYHDVGKIARPYFFTENQAQGINPHDRLDPQTSAEILIGHVIDGIEMAKRYHLPSRIRAFIPEHHGTNRVSFLYQKAVQLAGDPDLVDEEKFRYPGLKPQSKETALVMLADGCEAAVRSARPTDADAVALIVNRIIDMRVEDKQLNECNMTLGDLDTVRRVFAAALKGTFHPRIKYPEPNEKN